MVPAPARLPSLKGDGFCFASVPQEQQRCVQGAPSRGFSSAKSQIRWAEDKRNENTFPVAQPASQAQLPLQGGNTLGFSAGSVFGARSLLEHEGHPSQTTYCTLRQRTPAKIQGGPQGWVSWSRRDDGDILHWLPELVPTRNSPKSLSLRYLLSDWRHQIQKQRGGCVDLWKYFVPRAWRADQGDISGGGEEV